MKPSCSIVVLLRIVFAAFDQRTFESDLNDSKDIFGNHPNLPKFMTWNHLEISNWNHGERTSTKLVALMIRWLLKGLLATHGRIDRSVTKLGLVTDLASLLTLWNNNKALEDKLYREFDAFSQKNRNAIWMSEGNYGK